jgi:hypothetical protein
MDRFIVRYILPCSTSAESDSNWPGNKETENVSRMIISVLIFSGCDDILWVSLDSLACGEQLGKGIYISKQVER